MKQTQAQTRHTHQINKFPPLHHTRWQARSRHKLRAIIINPFLRLLSSLPVLVDFGGLRCFWWWWLIATWISFHVCRCVCLIVVRSFVVVHICASSGTLTFWRDGDMPSWRHQAVAAEVNEGSDVAASVGKEELKIVGRVKKVNSFPTSGSS